MSSKISGLSQAALRKSEPFEIRFDVPVSGGALAVARAGPPPETGGTVVLGLHGMSGTHMVYRTLARALCAGERPLCLLAPDLRGRGRSAHLPGPYGMAAHVADLLAVLDHAGADRAIVVGHSMGCNIAARFGADHPERTAALVLLDGGLPTLTDHMARRDDDDEEDEDEDGEDPPGLFDRFDAKFASADEYLAYWRNHPALKIAWDEDIEAFVHCDFIEDGDGVRCVANLTAILSDVQDVMFDGLTWKSVTRVRSPVRLMRAERGMHDDDPLIPLAELQAFVREHPHVSVELVADVNHLTLLLGGGHGPQRVAATVTELAAG